MAFKYSSSFQVPSQKYVCFLGLKKKKKKSIKYLKHFKHFVRTLTCLYFYIDHFYNDFFGASVLCWSLTFSVPICVRHEMNIFQNRKIQVIQISIVFKVMN